MVRRARIPISAPTLGNRESQYVQDCITSSWISSRGAYIQRFEERFASVCGARHAVSCNTGTAALHLAMLALGIGPGDEVIVPTLSYVASANAVRYCGADVSFADSSSDTWNVNPADVERAIGARTRAIMAVHLYGEPADLRALAELAKEHQLSLIEDAAEAHGALFGGEPVGAVGTVGAFSFYGNKIITTGEGGMLVTNDPEIAERALLFRGQGQAPNRTYWHPVIGYNYRMTNIEAAIGLAQIEGLEGRLERRRSIAARYRANLESVRGLSFQAVQPGARGANWLVGVLLPVNSAGKRDEIGMQLEEWGIETRPFFYPIHTMPPYEDAGTVGFPVAEDLSERGLCLPTWVGLEDSDIDYVSDRLASVLKGA